MDFKERFERVRRKRDFIKVEGFKWITNSPADTIHKHSKGLVEKYGKNNVRIVQKAKDINGKHINGMVSVFVKEDLR